MCGDAQRNELVWKAHLGVTHHPEHPLKHLAVGLLSDGDPTNETETHRPAPGARGADASPRKPSTATSPFSAIPTRNEMRAGPRLLSPLRGMNKRILLPAHLLGTIQTPIYGGARTIRSGAPASLERSSDTYPTLTSRCSRAPVTPCGSMTPIGRPRSSAGSSAVDLGHGPTRCPAAERPKSTAPSYFDTRPVTSSRPVCANTSSQFT